MEHITTSMTTSPDQAYLFSAGEGSKIIVWNTDNWE